MKRNILLIFSGLFILASSCVDRYYQEAELQVQVRGLLSGNPRDGIAVQVYETREDAEAGIYALTHVVYTDAYGEVFIWGLDPGRRYFIRVDSLVFTKVKSTRNLDGGFNLCTIRIL